MTDKDYEAGRELDALVAERVMGLKCRFERGVEAAWQDHKPVAWSPNDYIVLSQSGSPEPCFYIPSRMHSYLIVPRYSTDIAAAWEVVEKMWSSKYEAFVRTFRGQWSASFADNGNIIGQVDAETAPLAICRAVLKAVDAQKQ